MAERYVLRYVGPEAEGGISHLFTVHTIVNED